MAKIFKLKKLSLLVKPDGFQATQAFQEILDNRLKFDSWNLFLEPGLRSTGWSVSKKWSDLIYLNQNQEQEN